MRSCRWLLLFPIVACATLDPPRSVEVDVLGDGDATLVLGVELLEDEPGRERVRIGPDRLVVRLPKTTRVERVVVESEEGVDVLTLVVDVADVNDVASPAACHVWLAHREHQLAVVLQHRGEHRETTLAVFPPR